MQVLVTGAAGFIGFHLCQRLLAEGHQVVGIDNLNPYYDVVLKQARLNLLVLHPDFRFLKLDLSDRAAIEALFQTHAFDGVVNLAAQAGVRYSLQNPAAYIDSNLVGFANILEGCRHSKVGHLVFASSSSVYGANTKVPFATTDPVDSPVSLYAASKKANELMAHSYSHLYGLPTTGLRFFTVYGPWGRPDMAYFKFVQAIERGEAIDVYNHGKMKRDFTYIDDIIEGVVRVLYRPPSPITHLGTLPSQVRYKIYNIGNNNPVELNDFIATIELALGKTAQKNLLDMQPGDVLATYADVDDLVADTGFSPATPLEVGIAQFVDWYRNYYAEKQPMREVIALRSTRVCA
ncbi:MAG: NAD-dependent epimerase [Cyanobacteria bacterium P01_D01_bin.123]